MLADLVVADRRPPAASLLARHWSLGYICDDDDRAAKRKQPPRPPLPLRVEDGRTVDLAAVTKQLAVMEPAEQWTDRGGRSASGKLQSVRPAGEASSLAHTMARPAGI